MNIYGIFFICDSFCFINVILKRLNVNYFELFKYYYGFIILFYVIIYFLIKEEVGYKNNMFK